MTVFKFSLGGGGNLQGDLLGYLIESLQRSTGPLAGFQEYGIIGAMVFRSRSFSYGATHAPFACQR